MAKYSKAAQKKVESAMKRMEKGALKSGKSNKKVTNPKQAIAIGLSEARDKGAKVPDKKVIAKKAALKKKASSTTAKTKRKSAPKKTVAATTSAAKPAAKKAVTIKRKTPDKKNNSVTKSKKKKESKESASKMPVNPEASNSNPPPVEEKSPEIFPIVEKKDDPIMATDKKALAKAITKQDFKHHIQLSRGKQNIKSSSRKIMWR